MRMFIALCVLMLAAALPAQAQRGTLTEEEFKAMVYKDPHTAQLMSLLIAGGGHMYAREDNKGLALMGVGLGAPLLGSVLTVGTADISCSENVCREVKEYMPLYLGAAVGLAAWTYGFFDADNAARRTNRKNGITARFHPTTAPQPGIALTLKW